MPRLTPAIRRDEAQRLLTRDFASAGIASASIDARILLCETLGIDHAALIRDPALPLGNAAERLMALSARRLRHEPVSRLLGRREFWGLSFRVTPAVLDPRPDSETLIETVLDALGPKRHDRFTLLDLGTGSGALLGALLHACPRAVGFGIDRSLEASAVALLNMRALGLAGRAAIVTAHWGEALRGGFDVVVSNPPYIAHSELPHLEPAVADHDPSIALDGGLDGLDQYRIIGPDLPRLLRPGGLAAVESGWDQGQAVAAIMRGAGLSDIAIHRDLAGRDRVVLCRCPA